MSMKSKSPRFLSFTLLLILFPHQQVYSQNHEWVNHTYYEDVESIAGKGDTLWLATSGGLVKFNTKTEEKIYYNVSNSGLISNHIAPIALDSIGNVWIWKSFERSICFPDASTFYLVKFDGKEWQYYSPELSDCDFWGRRPIAMEIDYDNNIWLGMNQKGLINFDGEEWKFYDTTNSSIPSNNIVALDIDKENRIWLGLWDYNGLIMYDQFNWFVFDSTNSDCPNEPIINIEIDNDGNKWITTKDKIIKYDGNFWSVENFEILYERFIQPKSLQIDSKNDLWLFHSDLYHLSEDGWEKHNQYFDQKFLSTDFFLIDRNNNKWLNSYRYDKDGNTDLLKGGLTRFDNNKWEVFNISESKFKGSGVGVVFKDSKNNMWLGSDLLTKVKDNEWTYYSPYDWRSVQNITVINEDIDGNIWFGSYGDGLIKFDGSEWEYFNENNSNIPNNNIWDIAFDKRGNLWFTCSYEKGVVKFDGSAFIVYDSTNSGLPENDVRRIENDSNGNLYFGTASKGLVKYDFDSWITYDEQIKWNSIYSIFIDAEDVLWIGGFGITKFENGIWTHYEHDDSISYYHNVITEIDKDADNNLWVIARYGLYKFDGNEWYKYDHKNSGLPDEFLSDLEFDQHGNLWIGTSSGVVLFNESGVVTENKSDRKKSVISTHKLFQNYPNPFNPSTVIRYQLPFTVDALSSVEVHVSLKVFDILGRELATLVNEKQKPGNYELTWDSVNLPSGIYFYRLTAGDYSNTKKMIILR